MWNANRTIAKTKQNNSFAVAVMVLPLLSVVFYDFRLNGNWGVRSMFPHIHVYYSRIETGISFISKVKKKEIWKGQRMGGTRGVFVLPLSLPQSSASSSRNDGANIHSSWIRQPSSSSLGRQGYHDSPVFVVFLEKKQKTNSAGAANRKREGSLTSLPWQSNLLY